jgi:hypothetical protein
MVVTKDLTEELRLTLPENYYESNNIGRERKRKIEAGRDRVREGKKVYFSYEGRDMEGTVIRRYALGFSVKVEDTIFLFQYTELDLKTGRERKIKIKPQR